MLFVELKFFLFFAITLTLYWSLPTNNLRKWLLLGASYFFYGSWDWRFAGMLLVISYGDYFFAKQLDDTKDDRIRRRYVTASLAMNLVVLGYFKYFNFFIDSAVELAQKMGMHLDHPTLSIILPVGVSFFTFQSLSYTIDVYRKEIPAVKQARDYLLFSAFFPQLVAGPIVRPKYFLPQLESARTIDIASARVALLLFALGFFKKACLADNVSPFVDQVFQDPGGYDNLSVISAVWLYAVQIYCDFSGYTDMAIAVAGLMGYKLAINFNTPYLARSLQDFWRRWHISLSTWIRDYIYISLGGKNANRFITYRNLMYTMLAGGLWHGAAWTFVLWGGLHGAGQVIQQEFNHTSLSKWFQIRPWWPAFSWFLTLQFVCMCWIFFRAPDFSVATEIGLKYLFLHTSGTKALPLELLAVPATLLLLQYAFVKFNLTEKVALWSLTFFGAAYGIAWSASLAMLPLGYRPFIYFQF